jgi:hypothetical protein
VHNEETDLEDGDPAHREHPHRRRHHPWSDELHVSKEALPIGGASSFFCIISLVFHSICTIFAPRKTIQHNISIDYEENVYTIIHARPADDDVQLGKRRERDVQRTLLGRDEQAGGDYPADQ